MLESLFNKVTGLKVCNFIKKGTPPQLFSCGYHDIFKNSILCGTPRVAASENVSGISKKFQLERFVQKNF